MAMKVVVLDGGELPQGVDFPPLELDKYGWEQYPRLSGDEIADRCWRADIVVSLAMPLGRANLEKMHRLKLLVTAAPASSRVDQAAAAELGIELLAFSGDRYNDQAGAQELCDRISAAINHYLRNLDKREIDI